MINTREFPIIIYILNPEEISDRKPKGRIITRNLFYIRLNRAKKDPIKRQKFKYITNDYIRNKKNKLS